MPTFIYNASVDAHGNHEVHTQICNYLPSIFNRVEIGWYANCTEAIQATKNKTGKRNFDGCYYCCRECHKG